MKNHIQCFVTYEQETKTHQLTLHALRIIHIRHGACRPRDTNRCARPSLPATLPILGHRPSRNRGSRRQDRSLERCHGRLCRRSERDWLSRTRKLGRCNGRFARYGSRFRCAPSASATRSDRSSRCLVRRQVKAVVEIGNVDVRVGSFICARQLNCRRACASRPGYSQLRAANVELSTIECLRAVERQHLTSE